MKKNKMLVFAFLIPTAVMLVLFVIRGIFPFGDRSFLFDHTLWGCCACL